MPRRGEVRVRDARALLGTRFKMATELEVLVLPRDNGIPIAGRIELTDLVSGLRVHRVFACPACRRGVRVLIARRGHLHCRLCDRTRTRRQLERTRADWRRLGGAEEDAILRLLAAPHASVEKLRRAQEVARALAAADVATLARLQADLRTLQDDLAIIEHDRRHAQHDQLSNLNHDRKGCNEYDPL